MIFGDCYLDSSTREALYLETPMRKLFLSVATSALAAFLITGCGQDQSPAPIPVVKTVSVPTLTTEQQAMKAEADIKKVAKDEARSGNFQHASACNSTPAKLANLPAYQEFVLTGPGIYKTACQKEVLAMKQDRANQLAADEKQRQQKLAASAEKRKLLTQKKFKQQHPSAQRAQPRNG